MQDPQAIQEWIKDRANSIVLGLLFASLLVIYLVGFPNYQVTILGVIILAISLMIAVNGSWNDLLVLAIFTGLVSVIGVYLLAQMRFGALGRVALPLLWGLLLVVVGQRILRDIRRVPVNVESPAILIGRGSDRRPYVAPPPVIIPFLQPIVAVIPRKILIDEVEVEKLNTRGYHDVNKIGVHVRYQIIDPVEAFMHTSQSTLDKAARETGKSLSEARLDVTFWENLFENHLLKIDVAKAVREIVYEESDNAPTAYSKRADIAKDVHQRLNELVNAWGATINVIELDYFEIEPERVRTSFRPRSRENERAEATHHANMEAERLKLVLKTEVEAEAERVRAIIEALRQSEVEITPDVVIRAIRAASDWAMDSEYTLQPTTPPISIPSPAQPRPASDKK